MTEKKNRVIEPFRCGAGGWKKRASGPVGRHGYVVVTDGLVILLSCRVRVRVLGEG